MATAPTRRLATLFLLLAVPGLVALTWLTWQSLENGVQTESQRVLRFEELAASYVANSLRFELNRVRFTLASGDPKEILTEYHEHSRFPELVEGVFRVTARGYLDANIDLNHPVLRVRLSTGEVLEIRYSVSNLLQTVIPTLAREAFSVGGASPSYEAWVIRGEVLNRQPDWIGALNVQALDPPPLPDAGLIRQYLPTDPDQTWLLGVRVLPDGLPGYLQGFRMHNLILAVALFGVLALGAGLFLTSLIRVFGVIRRERTFSTLVSHELKTPLAALSTLSENLAEGVVIEASRVREYGGQLLEQTDRLGEMLNKILSISHLESSEAVLKLEEFDLVSLAREMADALKLTVESPVLVWNVRGNRAAIRAALDNLLSNALRYGAKEGETPVIEVELVHGYRWGTRWVGLSVSDHGPGLTDDEMRSLFSPYFRGVQAFRRQNPGSGIGLRMVWSTMRHLGGRVQVKAVSGGGLCLILWLHEGRVE
jgi:signal transduction histidine kinase